MAQVGCQETNAVIQGRCDDIETFRRTRHIAAIFATLTRLTSPGQSAECLIEQGRKCAVAEGRSTDQGSHYWPEPYSPPVWDPVSTKPAIRIRDVRAICTAPEGVRLVVVKIETTEPGL